MNEQKAKAAKKMQEDKKAALDLEGLMSIAEASRAIGCDRKEIMRLLSTGSLEKELEGEHAGAVVSESIHAYLDAISQKKDDPAVEHMKDITKSQIQHNERLWALVMPTMERIIESYEKRVDKLQAQSDSLFSQQIENMKLHKELADGAHDRERETKRDEANAGRVDKGVLLLEDYVKKTMMDGNQEAIAEMMKNGQELFASFSADQSMKMLEFMTPQQMKLFGKVAQAMGESASDEDEETDATAAE